jgi:hypothetical protein
MTREQLRREAEEIIRGRELFERDQLGGRKSLKPLPKVQIDPYDLLLLLDEV